MLTQNQLKALQVRGNLSVTANAGAGKTRVLVERFVDILLREPIRLSEIVAITFTEKAASELRKKISSAVSGRIAAETAPEVNVRLRYIRDNLASATIGTIHSFCAGLLREYPVEADIDAGFSVLQGHDRSVAEEDAVRITMTGMFDESLPADEREEYLDLVRMLGRKDVEERLRKFLSHRDRIRRLEAGVYAAGRTDDEILSRWNESIASELLRKINPAPWREAAASLIGIAAGKKRPEAAALLAQWNDSLPSADKIRIYREISKHLLTNEAKARSAFFSKGKVADAEADPSIHVLKAMQAELEVLLSAFVEPEGADANRALLRTNRIFLRLFDKFLRHYDGRKADQGQLDFDDLERKTIDVLNNPEVRSHAAAKYKFVMVDEFQDTNHSQYEILRLLLSGFSEGNCFIVGDPKQSIYGFRNAEVEIFDTTRRELLAAGAAGDNAQVVLPESFRLLTSIVLFINRIFSGIMAGGVESRSAYDALVRGRQNAAEGRVEIISVRKKDIDAVAQSGITGQSGGGDTSDDGGDSEDENSEKGDPDGENSAWNNSDGGEHPNGGEKEPENVSLESDLIARRLLRLKEEGTPVFHLTEDGEEAAPFRYSDAAILLRSRTHLKELERALIGANVPFSISSGVGYYQTQEIYDFVNYFTFLLNPNDDVALFGILRSPFFIISDAELFEVSISRKDTSLWERIAGFEHPSAALERARGILTADLMIAQTMPITMLIQRIVRQTAWGGKMSGLPQGEQHLANVEKLTEVARGFEAQGFVMLYDFVRRLRSLIDGEEQEGQAGLQDATDSVKITTIHAAKGLEFPVVFVPFIHTKIKFDASFFIDPHVGIGYPVRLAADYDKKVTPPLVPLLALRHREKTIEEEKRIMYVACTRARDILIISGQRETTGRTPNWMEWVEASLAGGAESAPPRAVRFSEEFAYLEKSESGYEERRAQAELTVHMLEAEDLPTKRAESSTQTPLPVKREFFLESLAGATSGEFYSATNIRTYIECPSKYYLKIRLGLPEQNTAPRAFDAEEDFNDLIKGELEGSMIHSVLEQVSGSTDPEAAVRESARALMSASGGIEEGKRDEIESEISELALGFVRSPFGVQVLRTKENLTEFTLNMKFGDDFLTGTIDRIWTDGDGRRGILDYKTDRISPSEINSRAALYRPQLEVYAFLVSRHFAQSSVRATICFLRHPATPVHIDFDAAALKEIEKKIADTIVGIRSGNFTRQSNQCGNCTYSRGEECMLPMHFPK